MPAHKIGHIVWGCDLTEAVMTKSFEKGLSPKDHQIILEKYDLINNIHQLKPETDIRMLIAKEDSIMPSDSSQKLVDAMMSRGLKPKITRLKFAGHFSGGFYSFTKPWFLDHPNKNINKSLSKTTTIDRWGFKKIDFSIGWYIFQALPGLAINGNGQANPLHVHVTEGNRLMYRISVANNKAEELDRKKIPLEVKEYFQQNYEEIRKRTSSVFYTGYYKKREVA